MKVICEHDEKVPTWALCYFVNADDSGLTEEDKQQADRFWAKYQRIADRYNAIVSFQYPDDIDSEKYFYHAPSFGSACDVADCKTVTMA